MTLAATVLIPTHDHGPTLRYSVRSVLNQTVRDLEVLVVGDGVPEVARRVIDELIREDGRVRFFDNPKGPRHGEIHRQAALAEARGQIVGFLRAVLDGLVRERGNVHAHAEARLAAVPHELDTVYGTATWRLRRRILGLPQLSRLARWAARALAGQGGR